MLPEPEELYRLGQAEQKLRAGGCGFAAARPEV